MIEDLLDQSIQEFIHHNLNANVQELAFQKVKYPEWPFEKVLDQIQSRQKAKKKLPTWYSNAEVLFPPPISMEQCSSERTANYKASLVKGESVLDLTGGFGIDTAFISKQFSSATYVEQNEWLSALASHNFRALSLDVKVVTTKAEAFLIGDNRFDLIYIDPARRSNLNQKVIRLEDYSPNVLDLLPEIVNKSERFMIKVSPMFDIKLGLEQLKYLDEVHVVAVKNEVKELLFIGSHNVINSPKIVAVNLDSEQPILEFSYAEEEGLQLDLGKLESYLYEPNAAIIKSGAYKKVSIQYGLKKLHPNTHLYTSDNFISAFPGRVFRVQNEIKPNRKEVKNLIPSLKANLTIRNYPMSVNELRKKIGLKEGGEQFLFGLTDIESRKLVLCQKLN